jgi:hypothetical protein
MNIASHKENVPIFQKVKLRPIPNAATPLDRRTRRFRAASPDSPPRRKKESPFRATIPLLAYCAKACRGEGPNILGSVARDEISPISERSMLRAVVVAVAISSGGSLRGADSGSRGNEQIDWHQLRSRADGALDERAAVAKQPSMSDDDEQNCRYGGEVETRHPFQDGVVAAALASWLECFR